MSIGAPEIVWFIMAGLSLGLGLALHGKPRTGNHNAWASIVGTAISFLLAWWGGFFK